MRTGRLMSKLICAVLVLVANVTGTERRSRPRNAPAPGVQEVIYAVRAPGRDPHWYANFGYWSSDTNRKLYGLLAHRYTVARSPDTVHIAHFALKW